MTDRLGSIGTQYFDNAGDPLIDGKMYIYESGTTTLKNTYADINETIANTNPVLLTGSGRQPNVFYTGAAKIILTDTNDVQIEVRDPVGGTEGGAFSLWENATIYAANDLVRGSDGNYYKSLSSGNSNNDPVSDVDVWTRVQFNETWNTNDSYSINDIVQASDGFLYVSITNSNVGNTPVGDAVNWAEASRDTLPDQSGNAGLFLQTDGTDETWEDPFPSQAGNSGKSLQTNGTVVSWQVSSDYVFLSEAVVSSDVSVDITLPSGYSAYVVEMLNFVVAANGLIMRTSSTGGSPFDAGASDYDYSEARTNSSSSSIAISNSTASSSILIGANSTHYNATIKIHSPSSVEKCTASWNFAGTNTTASSNSGVGSGSRMTDADVDAIQFLMNSGNLGTGTIRLYGIV